MARLRAAYCEFLFSRDCIKLKYFETMMSFFSGLFNTVISSDDTALVEKAMTNIVVCVNGSMRSNRTVVCVAEI